MAGASAAAAAVSAGAVVAAGALPEPQAVMDSSIRAAMTTAKSFFIIFLSFIFCSGNICTYPEHLLVILYHFPAVCVNIKCRNSKVK